MGLVRSQNEAYLSCPSSQAHVLLNTLTPVSHLCPRSLPNESDLGTKMTVFYQPLAPFCEAVTHEIQDFLGWYLRVGEDTQPAV